MVAGFGKLASRMYALFARNPSTAPVVVALCGLRAADRVLEVGCGAGGALDLVAKRIGTDRVAAVDPSPTFVTMVRNRVPAADVRVSSAEDLPFDDGTFTVIYSVASMHHWDDRSKGLAMIVSKLAPGGRLLIAERALSSPGHGITTDQARVVIAELERLGLTDVRAGDHAAGRHRLTVISATRRIRVSAGLVILVGPPASGKTSFVRALIEHGQIDEESVVSSDEIRAELFGVPPIEADPDAMDASVFEERDRRVIARLAAGQSVVAESTNVTRQARRRLVTIARRFDAPVTMLRFPVDTTELLRQHGERERPDLTPEDVRAYAAVMMREASAEQLRSEGAVAVHDVPGRPQGSTALEAAERFSFEPCRSPGCLG